MDQILVFPLGIELPRGKRNFVNITQQQSMYLVSLCLQVDFVCLNFGCSSKEENLNVPWTISCSMNVARFIV